MPLLGRTLYEKSGRHLPGLCPSTQTQSPIGISPAAAGMRRAPLAKFPCLSCAIAPFRPSLCSGCPIIKLSDISDIDSAFSPKGPKAALPAGCVPLRSRLACLSYCMAVRPKAEGRGPGGVQSLSLPLRAFSNPTPCPVDLQACCRPGRLPTLAPLSPACWFRHLVLPSTVSILLDLHSTRNHSTSPAVVHSYSLACPSTLPPRCDFGYRAW